MLSHLDVMENVRRYLSVPGADHAATRAAIRRAIEAAEVVVEGDPVPPEALEVAEAAWFIAWGANMDDGYTFHVVPATAVDAAMGLLLRTADGVSIENGIGGTAEMNPDGWRAWQAVSLMLGGSVDSDFDAGDLAVHANAFAGFSIRDPHSGNVPAAALDRRFIRVVHGYEVL